LSNGRTGTVFLEQFDTGLVVTFGAELVLIELDGEEVQDYAVQVPGVEGPDGWQGLIPVVFSDPEDVYQQSILPRVEISQSSLVPAMSRWQPLGLDYMIPAVSAETVIGSGGREAPSLVEMKANAFPYDIMYDVHLKARRRIDAHAMLKNIGRFLWAYGQIFVVDSEGDERGYSAFQESLDTLSDVSDVSERVVGYTISVRIEGELDFNNPTIARTTTKFVNRMFVK
jgi:hypothetical protein